MNLEALKEAVRRRRGKGLDLTILLGGAPQEGGELDEGEDEKLLDLAPDVKDTSLADENEELAEGEEHGDAEQDKALIAKMLDEHGKSPMREKMKAMKHPAK